MSTVITAGNATNGLSLSADNFGTFEFKTGTGAGTTALSIDASQNVTTAANLTVTGTLTAPQMFGQSQTWQALAGSRALGTTYTNSTNRPITVLIAWNSTSGQATASVGGVTVFSSATTGTFVPTTTFIVPAGATYVVSGGNGFLTWAELR